VLINCPTFLILNVGLNYMNRFNYKDFFPKNYPEELIKTKFKDLNDFDLKRWKNYKNRIPRSDFIKNSLKNKQSNICPVCSKFLSKNSVVHHIDYDRLCDFEYYEYQKSPTIKNSNREVKVPKCKSCKNSNLCMDKLVLIHNRCHLILHKMEGRISEQKEKISFPKKKRNYEIVSRKHWLSITNRRMLDLIDEILEQINNNSEIKVSIVYNKYFIGVKPENLIYFKPFDEKLKITVSYGDFGKWSEELKKKEIDFDIHKRTSVKLSFTIDTKLYLKNKDLILNITRDALNKIKRNENLNISSPQMKLF
jgi:hypothetical protein